MCPHGRCYFDGTPAGGANMAVSFGSNQVGVHNAACRNKGTYSGCYSRAGGRNTHPGHVTPENAVALQNQFFDDLINGTLCEFRIYLC